MTRAKFQVKLSEMAFQPAFSFSICAAFLTVLSVGDSARAGDKETPAVAVTEPVKLPISWESNIDVSGVARSTFEGETKVRNVDSLEASLRAIGGYQVRDGALIRFGLEFERHSFGFPERTPLPDALQAFHLTLGTDLQLGQAWLVRFEVQPGFYWGNDGIHARDFSSPMLLGASYFVSADLQLVAGVSYNPERKYPVLPGVGFRWKFATDWVLDAVLPTPRLEYSLSKSVTLYAGADLRDDTYRVSGTFGRAHGNPSLDNAVVDYSEIRVGGGATWKINNSFTFEAELGCELVDEFDFDRANVKYRSVQTPPYGGISLKAAF